MLDSMLMQAGKITIDASDSIFFKALHSSKILPKGLQPKSRINTKWSKAILQHAGKRDISKFDKIIGKNKVTLNGTTNIKDKKRVINMPSSQLTLIETDHLVKSLDFPNTSKTLPNEGNSYYRWCSKRSWKRRSWHDLCQNKSYTSKFQIF